MKSRSGFVSNSSSTSFVIENKTKERLHLCEFVRENPQLIGQFERELFPIIGTEYVQSHSIRVKVKTLEEALDIMCQEAKEKEKKSHIVNPDRTKALAPGENKVQFGDEEGTLLGEIYDYILRDGGESKRFKWRLDFYNR